MNNNILLAYIVSILPRLTLVFVIFVVLYKIYFKIRSKYSAKVNCWFCNTYSRVPYLESNSWTCTECEQYNGFTKDGGYNREIIQQFDCSNSSIAPAAMADLNNSYWPDDSNGFCDACNEAQRLKIEKLAQFEPKRESSFDKELKVYKTKLEEQYRLCGTCDRHLKSVLRDKKKMVLGSKFLEYIIKGAEALKQPHYNFLRQAKQELWKRRLSVLITVLTIVNVFCLFGSLPELSRTWFYDTFGAFGAQLFIACSHIVAFWRVLTTFVTTFMQNDVVIRLGLFMRTIFMMLLYSLGLRLPQLVRINFLSLYMLAAPFCILASTFSYNVIDRFRITRYTLLLVLWSIYAGGLMEYSVLPVQQVLMFLTSVFTCVLTFTNKARNSPKLYDDTASSFHKIYADDYLSDCDTATNSVLSQQLDCSSVSARSDLSRSFGQMKRSSLQTYEKRSPLTSSTFSLNLAARPNIQHPYEKTSPLSSSMLSLNLTTQASQEPTMNSSFKSYYGADNNTLRSRFGNSIYSFAAPARNPFMGSGSHTDTGDHANNSFGNISFDELNYTRKPKTYGFQERFGTPAPSLRSSFAATSNALHSPQRPSRLLSPTRFTFNTMHTGFVTTNSNSFADHSPFNQTKQTDSLSNFPSSNSLFDRRIGQGGLSAINEDISRASSRSSGFESQNGQINNSRENSCCAETNEFYNRTSLQDNSRQSTAIDGYGHNGLNAPFTVQRSLFSPFSTCSQPLSVNCSSEWHTSNRSNPMSRDSFNLRRFNRNLPSFKRGDLLKKWKEGDVLS